MPRRLDGRLGCADVVVGQSLFIFDTIPAQVNPGD
jgi:hypothetical protein